MGNTIATTSLHGDRLDEYDYTDYGVPIHSPVALDGRWIYHMLPHPGGAGIPSGEITMVFLEEEILEYNSLNGCEIRFMKIAPPAADDVYMTGTVIAHENGTVYIHDPGNDISDTWDQGLFHHGATAIFDLREGMRKGMIESAVLTSVDWQGMPWHGQPSTKIEVELEPFEWWFDFNPQRPLLDIQLGPNREPAQLLRLAPPAFGQGGNAVLEVLGHIDPADADTGKWYYIDGKRDMPEVAQSGTWAANAVSTSFTTFTLDDFVYVNTRMTGWMLQPDVNQQVYLPIAEVNPGQHTVTVAGDYKNLGHEGTRFRIFSPPGVQTRTAAAGTLDSMVSGRSSRCLYNGYRYESPLAGFWNGSAAQHRQTGNNFAGQHYTLHRHYDPVLMRFTSPDPAASPFYNLHHYAGNSPTAYYDPDGLSILGMFGSVPFIFLAPPVGVTMFYAAAKDTFDGGKAGAEADGVGGGVRGSVIGEDREVGYQNHGGTGLAFGDRTVNRHELMTSTGAGQAEALLWSSAAFAGDQTGVMGLAEAITGHSGTDGARLSTGERVLSGVTGTVSFVGFVIPGAGGAYGKTLKEAGGVLRKFGRVASREANLLFSPGRQARRGTVLNPFGRSASKPKMIGDYPEGSFSIINWKGYPAGIPRPKGPFRLLPKTEYQLARKAANRSNRRLHSAHPEWAGMHIHEIHPVKFGGSPTNPLNKVRLRPRDHYGYNAWWDSLKNKVSSQ